MIVRLWCYLMFLGLVSCTIPHPIENFKKINQCKMACQHRFNYCKKLCIDNCPSCSAFSSYTSRVNYIKYIHEEQITGGIIARGLNSYRDPLQCRKVSCSCVADLMTCNQGCTGIIQKKLKAVAYCS